MSLPEDNLEETSYLDMFHQIIRDIQTIVESSSPKNDSQEAEKIVSGLEKMFLGASETPEEVVHAVRWAISRYASVGKRHLSRANPLNAEISESFTKGTIVDVKRSQKTKSQKGPQDSPLDKVRMMTNKGILERLVARRSSDKEQNPNQISKRISRVIVKKRFIWLPCADINTSRACCLSTPLSERENMLSFFERHSTYEKYFFDDTTAVLNTSKTEFQLSFYQLHERRTPIPGIPVPNTVEFRRRKSTKDPKQKGNKREKQNEANTPQESQQQISRATMGFEFNGDFFDRYWTCHFVEYKPKNGGKAFEKAELDEMLQSQKHLPKSEMHKHPWRQRKVLELILCDRILEEITRSTEEIMNKIRSELKVVREAGSQVHPPNPSYEPSDRNCQAMHASNYSVSSQHASNFKLSSNPLATRFEVDALKDALDAAKFVSTMKGDRYLLFSEQSQEFEQILRVLDDDLSESLEQIER